MNIENDPLDAEADQIVEAALQELGPDSLIESDACSEPGDYDECDPWLADVICAHPHDSAVLTARYGDNDTSEDRVDHS